MLLYIVRHAQAGRDRDPCYPNGLLRPLTPQGQRRFGRLVERLVHHGFAPSLVLTSPVLRCRQTAEVLIDRAGPEAKLLERGELAPGGPWQDLIAETNAAGDTEVAWVGHSKDVVQITTQLIGSADNTFLFNKGAIAAIRFADRIVVGEGELRWFVRPRFRDSFRWMLYLLTRAIGLGRSENEPVSNHLLPKVGKNAAPSRSTPLEATSNLR